MDGEYLCPRCYEREEFWEEKYICDECVDELKELALLGIGEPPNLPEDNPKENR